MLVHRRLGPTGGARCEDYIGKIARLALVQKRSAVCDVGFRREVETDDHAFKARDPVSQMRLAQNHSRCGIRQHVGKACRGQRRVQRYVSAACLQRGIKRDDHLEAAFGAYADKRVPPHARLTQGACQRIGAAVEFAIGHLAPLELQRDCGGCAGRLRLEGGVEALGRAEFGDGVVEIVQQSPFGSGGQDADVLRPRIRLGLNLRGDIFKRGRHGVAQHGGIHRMTRLRLHHNLD